MRQAAQSTAASTAEHHVAVHASASLLLLIVCAQTAPSSIVQISHSATGYSLEPWSHLAACRDCDFLP